MKKILVIQRSTTTEADYEKNRMFAGKYYAANYGGDFILLESWLNSFSSKKPTERLHALFNVLEEADVVFMISGWLQDPMCRVLYEVAGMLGKTIVEEKE